jgi:hypothetical protein
MFDLAITGGLAVTINGTGSFDLGIANGKIVALASAGMLEATALRTDGKLVRRKLSESTLFGG